MSKYDRYLVPPNSATLKTVCVPVAPGDDLGYTMRTMEIVCKRGSTRGAGLAAPQIGVTKRLIFLNVPINGTIRGQFMLNPVITARSENTSVKEEGCLSYPRISKRIRRSTSITVEYETVRRERAVEEITDPWRARVIQHEVDHLDGICKVGDADYPADEEEGREYRRCTAALAAIACVAIGSMPMR